jgi:E3 ubiquitin-protein ligase TRIP12
LDGFSSVIDTSFLVVLEADDLKRMIIGDEIEMTADDLMNNTDFAHGYTENSQEIKFLFDVLTGFSDYERGLFVKFITGCERLPIGGLSALRPRLTIVASDNGVDAALPSVMTCTNYLKLPAYRSRVVMREKLLQAITEGQEAFLLT